MGRSLTLTPNVHSVPGPHSGAILMGAALRGFSEAETLWMEHVTEPS